MKMGQKWMQTLVSLFFCQGNSLTEKRDRDNAGMEYIATGDQINKDILILKAFKKARDSVVYSCASINSNAQVFGELSMLTHLTPLKTNTTTPPMTTGIEVTRSTTSCICLHPLIPSCIYETPTYSIYTHTKHPLTVYTLT
uniref:Uncharacterized protein n=1 Tax=Oncorhynchus tshawytscha TaxID=74940 RepID=A0A8C8F2E1_ONCTS